MLKRIRAFFADPVKELAVLLIELRDLKLDLKFAAESSDPLSAIVHFFDSVSRWHDRGLGDIIAAFEAVNFGQYDGVLENLRILETHFKRAGRGAMNRTKRGQTVTEDSVYLGNIFGLWTKTVRFWKSKKDGTRGLWKDGIWDGHPAVEGKNPYDVVSDQARHFMDSHIGPMIRIIGELESVFRAKAA